MEWWEHQRVCRSPDDLHLDQEAYQDKGEAMRIFGFSKKWDKLQQPEFTTFRFPRKDRDWEVGEMVQVIYKPRRKGGGEKLGVAEIIGKSLKPLWAISEKEAQEDGFEEWIDMFNWLRKSYPIARLQQYPMNKLTLRWMERVWVSHSL